MVQLLDVCQEANNEFRGDANAKGVYGAINVLAVRLQKMLPWGRGDAAARAVIGPLR